MKNNLRKHEKAEMSSALIRAITEIIVDDLGFDEPEQLAFITTLLIAFCRKLDMNPIQVVTEILSFIVVDMENENDGE